MIQDFLDHVKALLPTKQFTFVVTEKNKLFDRKYNLRDESKQKIIKSLQVDDCIEKAKNTNSRYPNADVYIFVKECQLEDVYGETETAKVYIKEYIITERGNYEMVVVISFHEEGLYDL